MTSTPDRFGGASPAARLPDPTGGEQLSHCGGRGVFLMRSYMTRVSYNGPGNHVTLFKRRGQRAAS